MYILNFLLRTKYYAEFLEKVHSLVKDHLFLLKCEREKLEEEEARKAGTLRK